MGCLAWTMGGVTWSWPEPSREAVCVLQKSELEKCGYLCPLKIMNESHMLDIELFTLLNFGFGLV